MCHTLTKKIYNFILVAEPSDPEGEIILKIIKKNQVVIFVIALMLVTAGYLNFIETNAIQTSKNDEDLGDAKLVSSNALVENDEPKEEEKVAEEISNAVSTEKNETEKVETASAEDNFTKNKELADEYFTATKLERDNMYSQIIETYQKMINAETFTAEQKAVAQNEITKINNTKNAIMITENLIKTKGFNDVVILANENSINVIISSDGLKPEEVSQVQNIVSREMKAEIENIHISNK